MALRSVKASLRDKPVTLPKFRYESKTSVEEALVKRRSVRELQDVPLALDDLGPPKGGSRLL